MRPSSRLQGLRGFSLIEMITVIALIAVMSASAVPVMQHMTASRERALTDECARLMAHARGAALATGRPHGVKVDQAAGALSMVRIASAGGAPTPALDAQGQPAPPIAIASRYGGAVVTAMTNGDGLSTLDTVWFGFDGVPELRDASGVRLGSFTTDAIITTTGGHSIRIRRLTGAIE